MSDKYEEMALQMRADGVSEKTIARFVAEEMEEDEFRRGKGVTEIEALRERRKIPEHVRKLLLANAFCHNCGTTEFAPGYTLHMRHGRVLVEGCCAKCGAEVARLCDCTITAKRLVLSNDALTTPPIKNIHNLSGPYTSPARCSAFSQPLKGNEAKA